MYRFHISHAGIAENDGRIFIYKLNMYSPACSAEVFPPEGDLIGDELALAQVVENARVGGEVKAQAVGVERLMRFAMAIKKGGKSLQERMDKEKKPYIFVGMVCVCEKYQGQGYMRKVMDIAFAEGNRLHVPVILETDAKSKCDKYVHLGMELAGTRDLGEFGKMYDLIKYPDAVPAEAKS